MIVIGIVPTALPSVDHGRGPRPKTISVEVVGHNTLGCEGTSWQIAAGNLERKKYSENWFVARLVVFMSMKMNNLGWRSMVTQLL
jgi:hypothetical protein